MKKFLAILMAVAMVASFAACGKDETPTPSAAQGDVEFTTNADDVINEDDLAAEETTGEAVTDASGEEVTEVVTDASGETVTDASGEAVTEKVTEKATEKDLKKTPVSQWSKQEMLNFYNAAVKKADEAPEDKKLHGQATMKLKAGTGITADGAIGGILKVVNPIVASALERNSNPTTNVPGYGEIKLSDLKSISATESNGKITYKMTVKEQTDGPAADGAAGPVGRAIGTLGNIDGALEELGASFNRGRDTVTLTYTDVTISATVDKATGTITGGTYRYIVNISVKDASIKISIIEPDVKNLKAYVDYTVIF